MQHQTPEQSVHDHLGSFHSNINRAAGYRGTRAADCRGTRAAGCRRGNLIWEHQAAEPMAAAIGHDAQ